MSESPGSQESQESQMTQESKVTEEFISPSSSIDNFEENGSEPQSDSSENILDKMQRKKLQTIAEHEDEAYQYYLENGNYPSDYEPMYEDDSDENKNSD